MKKFLLAGTTVLLAACGPLPHHSTQPQPDALLQQSPDSLAREKLSLKLVRFGDARTADSQIKLAGSGVIYEYQPDDVLQGAQARLGAMAEGYLHHVGSNTLAANKPTYLAEVDLTYLKTYIARGDVFSGNLGRYVVALKADVLVRDRTSKVVLKDSISVEEVAARRSNTGRQLSTAEDEQKLVQLADKAIYNVVLQLVDKLN